MIMGSKNYVLAYICLKVQMKHSLKQNQFILTKWFIVHWSKRTGRNYDYSRKVKEGLIDIQIISLDHSLLLFIWSSAGDFSVWLLCYFLKYSERISTG